MFARFVTSSANAVALTLTASTCHAQTVLLTSNVYGTLG